MAGRHGPAPRGHTRRGGDTAADRGGVRGCRGVRCFRFGGRRDAGADPDPRRGLLTRYRGGRRRSRHDDHARNADSGDPGPERDGYPGLDGEHARDIDSDRDADSDDEHTLGNRDTTALQRAVTDGHDHHSTNGDGHAVADRYSHAVADRYSHAVADRYGHHGTDGDPITGGDRHLALDRNVIVVDLGAVRPPSATSGLND
jgi:hypothetical protein